MRRSALRFPTSASSLPPGPKLQKRHAASGPFAKIKLISAGFDSSRLVPSTRRLRNLMLLEGGVSLSPLLLLDLFVVLVMLSIGLRVTGREMLDVLRNRVLFVRAPLANCVLIPGIGLLLVNTLPLTPDASVGILLLAASPWNANRPAIHPEVKDALGIRCRHDVHPHGREHRHNTLGREVSGQY